MFEFAVEREGVGVNVIDLKFGRRTERPWVLVRVVRRFVVSGMKARGLAVSRRALHDPAVQEKTC